MRKFYTLLAAVVTTVAFAQESILINVNGSLEDWDQETISVETSPEGWYFSAYTIENNIFTKHTQGAQHGNNFVSILSPDTQNNNVGLVDFSINAGETYSISYYVKKIDAGNGRFRHWGQWRSDSGAISVENDEFQPSEYLSDTNGEWVLMTATSVAPANATVLRFQFRTYPQNNQGGGSFGVDNVSLYQGTLSLKVNEIEGLLIYPNPANDLVHISSASGDIKNVSIYDLVGKKVLSVSTEQTVNVSALQAGVYIINVEQNGKTASRKLVIK